MKNELDAADSALKESEAHIEGRWQELQNRETMISEAEDKAERKLKDAVAEAQNRLHAVEIERRRLEDSQVEFR